MFGRAVPRNWLANGDMRVGRKPDSENQFEAFVLSSYQKLFHHWTTANKREKWKKQKKKEDVKWLKSLRQGGLERTFTKSLCERHFVNLYRDENYPIMGFMRELSRHVNEQLISLHSNLFCNLEVVIRDLQGLKLVVSSAFIGRWKSQLKNLQKHQFPLSVMNEMIFVDLQKNCGRKIIDLLIKFNNIDLEKKLDKIRTVMYIEYLPINKLLHLSKEKVPYQSAIAIFNKISSTFVIDEQLKIVEEAFSEIFACVDKYCEKHEPGSKGIKLSNQDVSFLIFYVIVHCDVMNVCAWMEYVRSFQNIRKNHVTFMLFDEIMKWAKDIDIKILKTEKKKLEDVQEVFSDDEESDVVDPKKVTDDNSPRKIGDIGRSASNGSTKKAPRRSDLYGTGNSGGASSSSLPAHFRNRNRKKTKSFANKFLSKVTKFVGLGKSPETPKNEEISRLAKKAPEKVVKKVKTTTSPQSGKNKQAGDAKKVEKTVAPVNKKDEKKSPVAKPVQKKDEQKPPIPKPVGQKKDEKKPPIPKPVGQKKDEKKQSVPKSTPVAVKKEGKEPKKVEKEPKKVEKEPKKVEKTTAQVTKKEEKKPPTKKKPVPKNKPPPKKKSEPLTPIETEPVRIDLSLGRMIRRRVPLKTKNSFQPKPKKTKPDAPDSSPVRKNVQSNPIISKRNGIKTDEEKRPSSMSIGKRKSNMKLGDKVRKWERRVPPTKPEGKPKDVEVEVEVEVEKKFPERVSPPFPKYKSKTLKMARSEWQKKLTELKTKDDKTKPHRPAVKVKSNVGKSVKKWEKQGKSDTKPKKPTGDKKMKTSSKLKKRMEEFEKNMKNK